MDMKKIFAAVTFVVAVFGFSQTISAAELTAARTVQYVNYDVNTKNLFITANEGNWGAAGCPAATTAYVFSHQAAKEAAAFALSAKLGDKSIILFGDCSGSAYFIVTSIYII